MSDPEYIPMIDKAQRDEQITIRYDLVPFIVAYALGFVLGEGGVKYGDYNWQKGWSDLRYRNDAYNHLQAHLTRYKENHNYVDLWHAFCNVAFLIWYDFKDRSQGLDEKDFEDIMTAYKQPMDWKEVKALIDQYLQDRRMVLGNK